MNKTTISDFEDQISEAKDQFFEGFKVMLDLVQNKQSTSSDIRKELTNLHNKGSNYFSLFNRSISEYGLKYFKQDQNIRNSKINDAIDLSHTIIKYWNLLKSLENEYDLRIPKPTQRAYSTIQLFIREFEPDEAKKLKSDFQKANLPIHGFITNRTFIDMTKKQQITYGIISGTVLLVVLLAIILIFECPTQAQNFVFKTVLSLAAASYSAAIPGFLNLKYREMITAGGALAVFVIVFLVKPTEISDYRSCMRSITGTVYFGKSPINSIDLRFPKLNQATTSDGFGSFNLETDFTRIDEELMIQLLNEELKIDTVVRVQKSSLSNSLDIHLTKVCAECTAKQNEVIKNQKSKCSGSHKYINDYIAGFRQASVEQGYIPDCQKQIE